ncbi:MAG: alcohol dehydrogenase catalytic domain-containing protein, partial [Candidatus Hydrothermarchaeales archaeon]
MKVAVYYNNRDVRIEKVPRPEIHDGELLVKIMSSGICGSDVMEWYRIKKAPLVLGHEITGVVEKVGEGIVGFHRGDRVVVTHHVPCDTCKYCQSGKGTMCETLKTTNFYPGGFAEYVRVPKINVEKGTLHLPDEISFEEGTFIEPLGCVVRGQRTVGIEEGQTVLVLGSGISGILHVQLAKVRGAKKVIATDVSQNRLNAAMALGADVVIDAMDDVPSRVIMENDGKPADRVVVCTGAVAAINHAFESVDRGGTILFFAPTEPGVEIPIHVDELWINEITLATSYGALKEDLKEAMDLIKNK